jgi:hypothetical protein
MRASVFFQKIIIDKYGTPFVPITKVFWKFDLVVLGQIDELIETHKEWITYPLDKQTKRKYMKAIDTKKVVNFVTKAERKLDKKDQTTFKVKMISVTQQAAIRDNLYKVSGTGKQRSEKFQAGTMNLDTIKMALVGWDNFQGEDGNPITFNENNREEMINMIPSAAAEEIANFVRGEAELDEGEG